MKNESYEFLDLKEKINSNNLIYKYKTKGRSVKDFSKYQNLQPIYL